MRVCNAQGRHVALVIAKKGKSTLPEQLNQVKYSLNVVGRGEE